MSQAIVASNPIAESARSARPFGAVAPHSLVWIVIAFAAYWALVRPPHGPSGRRYALDPRAEAASRGHR